MYLRKIWTLPPKERYKDRGATFPSLVDIYLHILDDHRFWFTQGYRRQRFDDYPLGIRMNRSQAERTNQDVEHLTEEVFGELRPSDLGREILPLGDRNPQSWIPRITAWLVPYRAIDGSSSTLMSWKPSRR